LRTVPFSAQRGGDILQQSNLYATGAGGLGALMLRRPLMQASRTSGTSSDACLNAMGVCAESPRDVGAKVCQYERNRLNVREGKERPHGSERSVGGALQRKGRNRLPRESAPSLLNNQVHLAFG